MKDEKIYITSYMNPAMGPGSDVMIREDNKGTYFLKSEIELALKKLNEVK